MQVTLTSTGFTNRELQELILSGGHRRADWFLRVRPRVKCVGFVCPVSICKKPRLRAF